MGNRARVAKVEKENGKEEKGRIITEARTIRARGHQEKLWEKACIIWARMSI